MKIQILAGGNPKNSSQKNFSGSYKPRIISLPFAETPASEIQPTFDGLQLELTREVSVKRC
jgi:hypothetical protein